MSARPRKAPPGTAQRCGRVAVLLGGDSAEREVSLKSGAAVCSALQQAGVDAFPLDMRGVGFHQLADLRADRVFNILHGGVGENGSLRAVFDFLGVPCTGSSTLALALTLDKVLTKKVLRASAIPTPDFIELHDEADCRRLLDEFGLPVFVKPVYEGSSIGMSPVRTADELLPAFELARRYGPVFAERYMPGAELTAGFVGDDLLPLVRMETPREFYDYEAKYLRDDTVYTCPSGLAADRVAEIEALVRRTIAATRLSGWGRIDLMLDGDGRPQIIEINLAPGMTDHSLVPMAGRAVGLEMPDLTLKILAQTLEADDV